LVEATRPGGATVTYAATASDPEDGDLLPLCTPVSGFLFPVGATTVTCTVTDTQRATASGSFVVAVRDTTAPVVAAPGSLTIPATEAAGARGASWPALARLLTGATATDAVDEAPRLTALVNGTIADMNTLFPLGKATTVTFSARDASGNVGTASSTVTVILGRPKISMRITGSGTVSGNRQFIDLAISNVGDGNARQAQLDLLLPIPVKGLGLPKLVAPKLPLQLGDLDVGATTMLHVILDVPTTVKTISLTAVGTFRNVHGLPSAYLEVETWTR
jgi:hypothetical protein